MAALTLTLGVSTAALAETPAQSANRTPNIFELPQYAQLQNKLALPAINFLRRRKFAEAETAARELLKIHPGWPTHHLLLAAALAQQGKLDPALESLRSAMDRGFVNAARLSQDRLFQPLHRLLGFEKLLSEMKQRKASPLMAGRRRITTTGVKDGQALVSDTNSVFDRRRLQILSGFHFPKPSKPSRVYTGPDQTLDKLNDLHLQGKASGNYGDLYDNRDRGHSALKAKEFPQLSLVRYSKKARAANLDYGLNANILFNAITFGNSSTALTGGPTWRSQARMMLTRAPLPARAYQQYSNNHVYIYPEHKDHDPKHGDLFPANTPYMIISQGSSGSDQPFLKAVSAILGAFQPDVKTWLRGRKLIAPTVQLIFRSGMKHVNSTEDYLSSRAHPTVFKADDIDMEKMIQLAQNFRADTAPPSVQLTVAGERRPNPGIDYFGPANTDEILFNTPSAIARVVRSTAHERRMIVDASRTQDPNGKPLRFVWKILRGNAGKISIKPMVPDHSKVEIRIKWHSPSVVPYELNLTTNRVDIAAFAFNGVQHSAPAFVSFYYPPNQVRTYDKNGQITKITYDPNLLSKPYVDPLLFARRGWQDTYMYTSGGLLTGWHRKIGKKFQRFTRHGAKVLAVDGSGRPIHAERLSYQVRRTNGFEKHVHPVPTRTFLHYDYANSNDAQGQVRICNQIVCNHH